MSNDRQVTQQGIRLVYETPADPGNTYVVWVPVDIAKPFPGAVRDAVKQAGEMMLAGLARDTAEETFDPAAKPAPFMRFVPFPEKP